MAISHQRDAEIRPLIAAQIDRLGRQGAVPWNVIATGVHIAGEHIHLASRPRGIFKPRQLRYLLSIRTPFPKHGRPRLYDDQFDAYDRLQKGAETVEYAFMGQDPNARDNQLLREAMEARVPVIYWLGISPAMYLAIFPVYLVDWDAARLKTRLAFGEYAIQPQYPELPEQRYCMRLVRQRYHQQRFREELLQAYEGRCAMSGLPEAGLLDAAHIIADVDQEHGQPIVPNGLLLSRIHHAAFDANLIGVDPDFRIRVADRLLEQRDGPMLEQGIKALDGRLIRLPRHEREHPDRERLARRYEEFREAG